MSELGGDVARAGGDDVIRILVTGSRMWSDVPLLTDSLDAAAAGHDYVALIHGRCDPRNSNGERISWGQANPQGTYLGADWLAHQHAVRRGWAIEAKPADWGLYGNAAGRVRNAAMVQRGADLCIAAPLPDGRSPGTRDCMRRAAAAGIEVRDITVAHLEGLW